MDNNNKSRDIFKSFCVENGFENVKNRNVFISPDGDKFAFSVTPVGKDLQCRQYYEDCSGAVILRGDFLYLYYNVDTTDKSVSRISPLGVKAYNITFDERGYDDKKRIR